MRILIDTNVLVDFLVMREPFYNEVKLLFGKCVEGAVAGYITTQSIADLYYILRKDFSAHDRRRLLRVYCCMFEVISVDAHNIAFALTNERFADFEDCLQSECAQTVNADCIVTRDAKGFERSVVRAVTPSGMLDILSSIPSN